MNSIIQNYNKIKSSVEQSASDFISDVDKLITGATNTNTVINQAQSINKTNHQILFTRQQMFQSLVELNAYKQKIIYLLICVIILIFIAFALIMYMQRGSGFVFNRGNRGNRINRT